MTERCPDCKSSKVVLEDSHKSWINTMNYKVVKYYRCSQCGNKWAIEQ